MARVQAATTQYLRPRPVDPEVDRLAGGGSIAYAEGVTVPPLLNPRSEIQRACADS